MSTDGRRLNAPAGYFLYLARAWNPIYADFVPILNQLENDCGQLFASHTSHHEQLNLHFRDEGLLPTGGWQDLTFSLSLVLERVQTVHGNRTEEYIFVARFESRNSPPIQRIAHHWTTALAIVAALLNRAAMTIPQRGDQVV